MNLDPTSTFARIRFLFLRVAQVSVLALTVVSVSSAQAEVEVVADHHYDMSVLPDDVVVSPWARVGDAPAFLMADQSLVINDNSVGENIAFQTQLGRVEAEHSVGLEARVKVLSNLDGNAVTMEIARPGLEAILRLYPDRMDLVEREEGGRTRWLGTAFVDLSDYHVVALRKASLHDDPDETLSVLIDGEVVLTARPRATGGLGIGRLLMGSLSYGGVGASLWDWVSYRLVSVTGDVAAESVSFGALKAGYADR